MVDRRFKFRTEWHLAAEPQVVYDVLADVESYPRWWPQVRSAQRIDEVSGELTCRSLLPYDLVFVMHRDLEDPDDLVLRARMTGDLVGTSKWTVTARGDGCLAVFEEEVGVGSRLLDAAGRVFRPALRFNHDHMMRSGQRGLRKHLATLS